MHPCSCDLKKVFFKDRRATGWDPAEVQVSYNEGMRKRKWRFAGLALSLLAVRGTTQVQYVWLPSGVQAMAWNPAGTQLLYTTDGAAYVWPGGTRIALTPPDPLQEGSASQVRFNPRGDKALVLENQSKRIQVLDLKRGTATTLRGDFQAAFWAGDEVGRIRPFIVDDSWSERQYVQIGSRKRALPRSMSFTAVDSSGTVFLAKEQRYPEGAIALYAFDARTLRVRRLRSHKGPLFIEYDNEDQLDWDPKTQTAAIGLTADTGGTSAALYLSTTKGLRPYVKGFDHLSLANQVRFCGRTLLVPSAFQIDLFDPGSWRRRTVVSLPPWKGQADPDIVWAAALSPDGNRLAWSQDKGEGHALYIQSVGR